MSWFSHLPVIVSNFAARRAVSALRFGRISGWAVGVACAFVAAGIGATIERNIADDGTISLSNSRPAPTRAGRKHTARAVAPATVGGAARYQRFAAHVEEAAALYQLPVALIRAVMKVESNFDPRAVSHANAHGLMQLMPQTAERMMVTDIFDPRQNILGGARYLRVLANTFNGDLSLTLAAYNAGEGAVARYGGIPPYEETEHYVATVTRYYKEYLTQP